MHSHAGFRIYAGFVLMILYAVRMMYRGFIKRDIRRHMDEVYLGLGCLALWAVVCLLISYS